MRFYQIGQPASLDDLKATGVPFVHGILADLNCPVIAVDVNDRGVFADTNDSRELVRFADADSDGNGIADDGIHDSLSSLK